ncbi:ribosomal protein 63, mitochondrial-like [Xenia sp. Carnegie-2017]|uniref:ribosomal protein 63, mitochondrial-like n=1 Tax=Xenia sp. Carnegie-2017 TaxID=2897299 RepID=UPI001F033E88|nr:ribosomal protein 63, mitochondrial-like [Xenia sp. Carnegie-2017]
MWITAMLCRRHVPGRIFSGKHRVAVKGTKFQRKRKTLNNKQIENNEKLLSYPFFTVTEEHAHATTRNEEQRREFFANIKRKRNFGKPTILNTTSARTGGHLKHLDVARN